MEVEEYPKVQRKVFVAIVFKLRNNHVLSLCLTHCLFCHDLLLFFSVK